MAAATPGRRAGRARRAGPDLPPDLQAMLDAHVAHEVRQWSGPGLAATLRAELDAAWQWAEATRLADVVEPGAAARAVADALSDAALPDSLVDVVADGAEAAHDRLLAEGSAVGDVVDDRDVDALVDVAAGMTGVRDAVIDEVTTSEVYARLIAHVLYTGIKDYLLTQNLVARRVPGASTLLRLGQSAVGTAAPGLEKGIDRQLTAFVASNVADTIRDSRTYLEGHLDDELLRQVSADVWSRLSRRDVGAAVAVVDTGSVGDAAVAVGGMLSRLRGTPVFRSVTEAAVGAVLEQWSDRPLAELLAAVGATPGTVVELVLPLLAPAADAAAADGHLAARCRARLGPFYTEWAAARVTSPDR